ncbi:MAG: efflux RND transporter periplasmic adaptor subunit [Victivallaceae bacterium]|nr:efflux RND transporter periplasmic adaptor subunit [Victivallaceae bacterium]
MSFISYFRQLLPAVTVIWVALAVGADDKINIPPDGKYDQSVKVVLFPFREAVIPALTDSRVMKYYFHEGENFPAGKILAELDKAFYRQRLLQITASVKEAEAHLDFTKKNLVRTKDLFAKGVQGHAELERAELDAKVAEAKYLAAKASYSVARRDLASCDITAPFDGRLVERLVNEYEYVRTGQPIMKIIDDNQLLAVTHLPSGEMSRISLGQRMRIKVDETGTVHQGKIYKISGIIDPGSRTFEIRVLLDNRKGLLTSGMSGLLLKTKVKKVAGR